MDLRSVFTVRRRYNDKTQNFAKVFETGAMESATSIEKPKNEPRDSDPMEALDSSERHAVLAARITECADRAFRSIGLGSVQDVIYWNLLVTRNVERDEIIDKPREFIEGLQAINGEAWTVVFEYMLRREIRSEFGLTSEFDTEPIKETSTPDLLHLIAHLALES